MGRLEPAGRSRSPLRGRLTGSSPHAAAIDLSGGGFSLPTFCTASSHGRNPEAAADVSKSNRLFRDAACGGYANAPQVPTASTSCPGAHRPCAPDLSPRARELFLLDWWFASESAAADRFAVVASEAEYANYTWLTLSKLTKENYGGPLLMGHGFWGMHMLWGLHAPLRFVSHIEIDFSLGRMWKVLNCRATSSRCVGTAGSGSIGEGGGGRMPDLATPPGRRLAAAASSRKDAKLDAAVPRSDVDAAPSRRDVAPPRQTSRHNRTRGEVRTAPISS